MSVQNTVDAEPKGPSAFYDPKIRGYAYQGVLILIILGLVWGAAHEAAQNMAKRGIPLNFDFWHQTAGFEINQTLIPYSAVSSYGQAFWVGLLNTLLVGVIGIFLSTIIGFVIGGLRLSSNWMIARLAMVYVELFRNVPLLLQLLFWYNAVLKALPAPRQSISLFGFGFLNNRGMVLPNPVFGDLAPIVGFVFLFGIAASVAYAVLARRKQMKTGTQSPVLLVSLGLIIGLPVLAYLVLGLPIRFEVPQLKGFNFVGGRQVFPELLALVMGLSIYTGAYIAEIVRAGIQAVARGQSEAAEALGLHSGKVQKLVIVPQALRVIIPPMTNQYLNVVKNSSLAVFVGYPDLVQVFAGTVLNQTGAAIQVMGITMAVYLFISLVTSFGMNIYNSRVALVER